MSTVSMIAEDVREQVREAAPVDVIAARYTDLRRAGSNLKGLCPMHDEKNASFHLTPARGRWHCFGSCGVGGDVFDLVMAVEHVPFPEAVALIAEWVGVRVPQDCGEEASKRAGRLRAARDVLDAAAGWFNNWLYVQDPSAQAARRWLADRRFTRADVDDWGIGYAPPAGTAVAQRFAGCNVAAEVVALTGPLVRPHRGGATDRMVDRIVFTLRDDRGRIVGFAGRCNGTLPAQGNWPGDGGGKYVNPDSGSLYNKSATLYAFDRARHNILRQQQAVIVEGYTDAMALHLAGVSTAVAQCGTAFTEGQARLLGQVLQPGEGTIIAVLDGDDAGWKATWRQFLLCQDVLQGMRHRCAVLPAGQDPCSLRVDGGDAAAVALIASAQPTVEVALSRAVTGIDLADPEAQQAALIAVNRLLGQIKTPVLQSGYRSVAARLLGVDDGLVHPGDPRPGPPRRPSPQQLPPEQPVGIGGLTLSESNVLWALLEGGPPRAAVLAAEPNIAFRFDDDLQPLVSLAASAPGSVWQEAFTFPGRAGNIASMLAAGHEQPPQVDMAREVSGMQLRYLEQEMRRLREYLAELPSDEVTARRTFAAGIAELNQELRDLLPKLAKGG